MDARHRRMAVIGMIILTAIATLATLVLITIFSADTPGQSGALPSTVATPSPTAPPTVELLDVDAEFLGIAQVPADDDRQVVTAGRQWCAQVAHDGSVLGHDAVIRMFVPQATDRDRAYIQIAALGVFCPQFADQVVLVSGYTNGGMR